MKDKSPRNDVAIFGLGFFAAAPFVVLALVALQIQPQAFSTDRFSSSDFATLFAGILGAAIGGAISWILARQASTETLARDTAARVDDHKAKALGVLLKVQQITNGIYTNRGYFWVSLDRANKEGRLWDDMWHKVQRQVGNSLPPPTFDASEFVPLMLAGKAALINECTLLALRYDVAEQGIATYNREREAFEQAMLPYSKVQNNSGLIETNVPEEKLSEFAIKRHIMNGLIDNIYRSTKEDYIRSKELCVELSAAFLAYFGDSVFARLDNTESTLSEKRDDTEVYLPPEPIDLRYLAEFRPLVAEILS